MNCLILSTIPLGSHYSYLSNSNFIDKKNKAQGPYRDGETYPGYLVDKLNSCSHSQYTGLPSPGDILLYSELDTDS